MVGNSSTVTPSAAEASSEVPRLEESEVCTASAVVEAGTAMAAVMSTLAAATLIVTKDLSTLAASATFCCKIDVPFSEKSLTLPLTVSVSTTVPAEPAPPKGGGDGGSGTGGADGAGLAGRADGGGGTGGSACIRSRFRSGLVLGLGIRPGSN